MADNLILPPVMYGIWRPRGNKRGWWQTNTPTGAKGVFSTVHKSTARHYAHALGNGAYVRPIDTSLEYFEAELRATEDAQFSRRMEKWIPELAH